MTTASAAVVGAMYIAGEAVVGDAGAFRAVDPADGAALEPVFQFADGKLGRPRGGARRGRLRAVPRRPRRAARPPARARRRRDRRGHRGGRRARSSRDRPAPPPAHRRGGQDHRTAPAVRRRAARGKLERGAHRSRAARPQARPAARRPAAARAGRAGRGVRRQQLPARLLGRRGRHRLGPRGRLPGGGQGARRPPRHLGDRRGRGQPRGRRQRAPGRRFLAWSTPTAPTVGVELVTHPAIAAVGFTGSRRGGLALVAAAAPRPVPIPVYRRDERRQPGLPAARAAGRGGRPTSARRSSGR